MKKQTDCEKCIYSVKMNGVICCHKLMRMSNPKCPLYDDGKEVRE